MMRSDPLCDRTISLYGYVRGANLKRNMKVRSTIICFIRVIHHYQVHIPGCGDFNMKEITSIPDPCPLPTKIKRTLKEKERVIYAPMSDLGNIFFDKDAVYINVPDQLAQNQQRKFHVSSSP